MTVHFFLKLKVNSTDPAKKWQTASGLTSAIKRIEVTQDNGDNKAYAKSTYEYAYFSDKIPMGTPDELKLYEVRGIIPKHGMDLIFPVND